MSQINPYVREEFEPRFKNTPLYKILQSEYDVLNFDKIFEDSGVTPRQKIAQSKKMFSATVFYYLEFLTSRNPDIIYDLGCGWNIFKKYIPNVIGVGAEQPGGLDFFADIHDFVDDDYIAGHQNAFESVFSINALHFIPLSQIQKRVLDFYSMIAPNGVGWLALNLHQMIKKDIDRFGNSSRRELEEYVTDQLSALPVNYLVYDIDFTQLNEFLNGNIRLVMEKKAN